MLYKGLSGISGSLVILDGVQNLFNEEMVRISVTGEREKTGRVARIDGNKAIIQVFEGTHNLSLENTVTRFTGRPLELKLSPEIMGRVFDGLGRPIDGLGAISAEQRRDINGAAINPVAREYPRSYIQTGISAIDGLATLIRGQKLPIFSGDGLPHDKLAAQILRQASLGLGEHEPFAVVFGAMGVQQDVAAFFRRALEESGASERAVMFLNLANDPVVERIVTPRVVLTAAEYLAYDLNMHVLVILTDMTAYAEALREIASSRGEIPSRKGYPGYLYSELASIFERAGILRGRDGSVTQVPILTMPGDDITHPIPDLTGFITEGQIVLDRSLFQKGVYPPVNVLPSLSRLMKDSIGEGYTRDDHPDLSNQLFSAYAKVGEVRALASVIGEGELSSADKTYIHFGHDFEARFVNQSAYDNRGITETLDIGWGLLNLLPKEQLDRIRPEILAKYYRGGE